MHMGGLVADANEIILLSLSDDPICKEWNPRQSNGNKQDL